MKFALGVAVFAALAILGQFILPWWGFVIIAVGVGFGINMHGGLSFLCGFITMAMLWGGYAWWIDSANDGQLSAKMAELLQIGSASTLWWITIALGGLLGGLGMATGKFGRDMIMGDVATSSGKKKYRNRYR